MTLAEQKVYYTEEDYYNLPEDIRAEIIDGEIYARASPNTMHQRISGKIHTIIDNYITAENGSCDVFNAPYDVKLSDNPLTIVQPDILVVCDKDKLDKNRCNGAPDWIIEIISPGTASHDYVKKLNLYFDAGVKEYWIVDPVKEKIFVYHLEESGFDADTYTFQDKIQVSIFDDFEIDFQEISKRL